MTEYQKSFVFATSVIYLRILLGVLCTKPTERNDSGEVMFVCAHVYLQIGQWDFHEIQYWVCAKRY